MFRPETTTGNVFPIEEFARAAVREANLVAAALRGDLVLDDLDAIGHGFFRFLERMTGGSGSLTEWRHEKEKAARPPITADQVAAIRDRVKELGLDEAKLSKQLRVPSIEAIKDEDFGSAMGLLHQLRQESQRKPPE